jgi:signal transduction histidine kinase
MSHELRTPLNGLLGFAELMQEGVAGPLSERGTEFLHHVLTSGRHFLQVINDVLDLARLEAGSLDCHPAPVDLRMLIEEVLQTLRPTLLSKSQHVAVHIDPACTQVINDPAMLKQLLYQYLSNAIKFNPRAGTVTLRASMQESGTFRLEVTDIGIGIEPQDVDRLFTPFEQLDEGVRKRFEGAGVGLALAKRIAELQGGRVGVESSPNKGSTFFAVLPRVVELQPVLENRSR